MLDLFQEAITPKTKLVALSHIQFSVGLRMPIEDIAEMAHRAGALVVIDGAQTGGHVDINVRKIGADFYAISGQKWLCGPQATGAFWADPDRIRQIAPPWQTHKIADERAESGETAGAPHMLQRFRLASQSPALVAGFTVAIEQMLELRGDSARERGTDAIEKHAQDLGDRLRNGIGELGACRLIGPNGGPESCGLVAVELEGWQPSQVVNELWDRWKIAGRAVRHPAAVRFSMAAFNNESDADAVVDALRTLSKRRAATAAARRALGELRASRATYPQRSRGVPASARMPDAASCAPSFVGRSRAARGAASCRRTLLDARRVPPSP